MIEVGTVIHGTLRFEHLIPAFMDVLEAEIPEEAVRLTTEYAGEGWPCNMAGLLFGGPLDEKQEELASYLLDELFDALNEIAPEGTYFGASEGDGTDYGFWHFEDEEA